MLSFLKNKIKWAGSLKPGDIIEDHYSQPHRVLSIKNKYEYYPINCLLIFRWVKLNNKYLNKILSFKRIVDVEITIENGNVLSAIEHCAAVED